MFLDVTYINKSFFISNQVRSKLTYLLGLKTIGLPIRRFLLFGQCSNIYNLIKLMSIQRRSANCIQQSFYPYCYQRVLKYKHSTT